MGNAASTYRVGVGVLAVVGRAVAWNVALGSLTGLVTGIVMTAQFTGEEDLASLAAVVPILALGVGFAYGLGAGVVHGVAQFTLLLVGRPVRVRRAVRVVATLVSLGLVVSLVLLGTDPEPNVWRAAALGLGPYIVVTPFVAVWGYVDASTAAAESAARRSGASTASRISGSASDSSRAASE